MKFDCRACQMHMMGKMHKSVFNAPPPSEIPYRAAMTFARQQPVSYLLFMANKREQDAVPSAYQALVSPLLFPDGETACIHNVFIEYKHVLPTEYAADAGQHQVPSAIHLSMRQQEVLFLLCFGYSQEQIGQTLQIGRASVSHMITEVLCPRFGLQGASSKQLIQYAIQHGLHRKIPPRLLKPMLIPL